MLKKLIYQNNIQIIHLKTGMLILVNYHFKKMEYFTVKFIMQIMTMQVIIEK